MTWEFFPFWEVMPGLRQQAWRLVPVILLVYINVFLLWSPPALQFLVYWESSRDSKHQKKYTKPLVAAKHYALVFPPPFCCLSLQKNSLHRKKRSTVSLGRFLLCFSFSARVLNIFLLSQIETGLKQYKHKKAHTKTLQLVVIRHTLVISSVWHELEFSPSV